MLTLARHSVTRRDRGRRVMAYSDELIPGAAFIRRWSRTGEKFDKLQPANSVLVSLGEVGFNGSILRNQVNASCVARTSFIPNPKYNLCFLQVSIVTQKPSRVRGRRRAFVRNCSSNGWLLFMVSCYGASLLMLAPGTRMHFHLTRSSPALSSDVVSISL